MTDKEFIKYIATDYKKALELLEYVKTNPFLSMFQKNVVAAIIKDGRTIINKATKQLKLSKV